MCKLTCETDLIDQTLVYFLSSHFEKLIGEVSRQLRLERWVNY